MADSQVLKALLPDNPLCGISTYKDTLNLATGACTRQIKKVVFDGTEEWNYEVSVGYHNFYIATQYSDGVTSSKVVCSHQVSINAVGGEAENCWLSSTRRFNICIQQFGDSLTEFKAWLAAQYAAGTPVTFWYMLSSSTSETIPVPSGLTGTVEGDLNQDGTPTPTNPIYPTANNVEIWQHSLRKLTTATEAVENPLYSDGTAITVYTLKGNEEHTGTPSPSNPITINGVGNKTANLMPSILLANGWVVGYLNGNNGTYNSTNSNGEWLSPKIALTSGETITISAMSISNPSMSFYCWNGTTYLGAVSSTDYSGSTFTTRENTTHIQLAIRAGSDKKTEADIISSGFWVMMNVGSTAKPYEPYGYKNPISSGGVTTNIYLGSTQTVRQIKKYILTGEESIAASATEFGWIIKDLADTINNTSGVQTAICSHYQAKPNGAMSSLSSGEMCVSTQYNNRLNFVTTFATTTAFSEYLAQQYAAGTPVTVWYVLATPETAAVNEPLMKIGDYADTLSNATSIPTTEGANSITVDTTVQPSEFTATWTGWHDSSVQEYDGTNWQ